MTNPRKQLVERVAKAICPQIYGSWQESSPVERLHALDVAEDAVHVIQPKRTKAARDTERLDWIQAGGTFYELAGEWYADDGEYEFHSPSIRKAIDLVLAAEKKAGERR